MFIRSITLFCMTVFSMVICYAESKEQPCLIRVHGVIMKPDKPETIYINVYDLKANEYVIYESLNAGTNWRRVSSTRPVFQDFIIDQKDSKIIYLPANDLVNYGGNKSIDSGVTWNFVATVPNIINPHNNAIMYSIGRGGIRKSIDGGDSWVDLKGNLKRCGAIGLAYQTPQILYAYCEGEPSPGIFKSINAGEDWKMVLPIQGVRNLVVDPNNTEIVYAGTRFHGIYRSLDGGKLWNDINRGLPKKPLSVPVVGGGEEAYKISSSRVPVNDNIESLVGDPIHSNILYAGMASGIFKSIDFGINWRDINKGLPKSSVSALAINPKDPKVIYIGTLSSGVFKSTDGGETWTPSSNGIACGPEVLVW